MKEMLFGKTDNGLIQFLRYIFVGGIAAAVDTAALYLLYAGLHVNYLIAGAAGFILGLATNYIISILWVFESTGKVRDEFLLFSVIGLGGLVWTELILWIAVGFVGLIAAKIIALVLVLLWNFGMRKKFVFRSK